MPIVNYRARDARGRPVVGQMEAPSLRAAQQELTARGLRDLIWDSEALVPDLDGTARREERRFAPHETKRLWRVFLFTHWWFWLLLLVMWLRWIARHNTTWWSAPWGLTAIGLVLFVVFLAPVAVYRELQVQKKWRRWSGVRRSLRYLRFSNFFVRRRVLSWAYDCEEARYLAATGRLELGLALVENHRGRTTQEQAQFQAVLLGIYEAAHRYDDALRMAEESAAVRSADASPWLDVARLQVRRFRAPVKARQALARAEGLPMSELARAYQHMVMGMILVEEDTPESALVELDRALSFLVPAAQRTPSSLVELSRAYRAWALGQSGAVEAAAVELASVRPLFRAQNEDDLLALVETAIADARAGVHS